MKKEETKKVNNDFDKSFGVINNLVNKEFKNCKSYNDSIKNLETIEKIFKKLNYIPNPDIIMKLVDENLLLSGTIKIIVNNNLDMITKGEINKIFDNDTIILIIESYCMMNNIKIQESEEDNEEFEENIINYEGENIDIVKLYLNEISRRKLLTLDEEIKLTKRIKDGDEEAKKIFIESNLRLVISVARKHLNQGLSFLDLIQEGNIGLMKAVDKFDSSKGYRFSTYATWWIRQGITRAINNIEIYRKKYKNAGTNTKSFLKDDKRTNQNEDDNMVKTIYEYFKNYSKEEVDKVLSTLSEESLELIRIRYGDDLTVPVNNKLTEEQRKKFYGSVMAQIKRLLENPDIKRRKVQKKEIEEEKIESTSIVENVQTKNNLVETNEEHTSKITKDDYINMIKLFKTSNFKQMISNLGSKESIIISLRMGYIDGKYFSVDAIAEFLDIERDEVSKIIKEVLLNYKESVIKSIDHAIEVASDEQNVLKKEKDIKEKKYRKF